MSFDGHELFDVTPYRVGFADAGYDLAVLFFEADEPELIPLKMGSWDGIDFGTPIHNYANPLAGVRQSSSTIEDPVARGTGFSCAEG